MDIELRVLIAEHGWRILGEHLRKDSRLESYLRVVQCIAAVNEHVLFLTVPVEVTIEHYLTILGQPETKQLYIE